jgi:aquacobalamin reductase/NAD(P)H-flavin reductase
MTSPIQCDIQCIDAVTDAVYRVQLKPQSEFVFKAGQYLLVHMSDEDKRPFSIASKSEHSGVIELHIGADKNNAYAYEALERMQTNDTITVSGGFGEAYYRDEAKANILVAGGTGFSYTYSILLEALSKNPDADVTLYWGARKQEDFYLLDELTALSDEHKYFTLIPVVEFPGDDWKGRTGWVHKAVLNDYPSLSEKRIYIAGRFEMAKTARDDFHQQGLPQDALFGDAYAFI